MLFLTLNKGLQQTPINETLNEIGIETNAYNKNMFSINNTISDYYFTIGHSKYARRIDNQSLDLYNQ